MFITKMICSHFCVESLKLKPFNHRMSFIYGRGAVVTFVNAWLMLSGLFNDALSTTLVIQRRMAGWPIDE
jgi:hypothetical protein